MAISTLENIEALSLLDDLEPNPTRLCDLSLEKHIRLLETFKSWKDIEKGKAKGRGFGNAQILNPKRDSDIYTKAEQLFKDISDSFGLKSVHELRIQLKDRDNRPHNCKLDFFYPESRIDVEISPDFHKSYKLVAIRDLLRKKLLNRQNIRVFVIRVYFRHGKTMIDVAKARKVCKLILEAKSSPDCLTYWI